MIWGPNDKRFLKLFRGIEKGTLPIIGDGKTWTHWIMNDDLARAFRLAGKTEAARNQTFIIAGDRPVTMSYVYEQIALNIGVKPKFLKIPIFPICLTGASCESVCLPFGIEPTLFRRRVEFTQRIVLSIAARHVKFLGFQPRGHLKRK